MVFHWRLSNSKSPQVSRTPLSIPADLNNAVVWKVSTRPPTSKSSRPFKNLLITVPKAPVTIIIIFTFIFHSFFNSITRSRYLSLFSHSLNFILWSAGTAKSTSLQIFFFFFLLIIIRSDLLTEIRWSVCMSNSHQSLCVSFSRTVAGLCIYHLLVWSNLNFLHISQWITLPTQSCIPSVPICGIRLLCEWWFHLCHGIAYICYFLASYLLLPWYDWFFWRCFELLLGEILFLSKEFPFLSHVQVLSYEILFIRRLKCLKAV